MKNYKITLMLLGIVLLSGMRLFSQEVVDPTTLDDKIMAGYQGWFAASGDGSGYGWIHWSRGSTPDASNITIDFWPDMREYDEDELFETHFIYQDLTNAGLYSAYTRKTVERHVKWMKDYGIDGVFVQRFLGSTARRRDLRDTVLQNVRHGAEKYGRVFANMYDISGGDTETMVEWIKNDWMHLVDDLKILESPNYLHHNGLPVLSIWGFGLSGRPGTPVEAQELIDWLKEDAPEKYRVTLKAGVDDKWQTHSAEWQAVYERFDVISPWAVGRYGDIPGADNFRETKIEPDLVKTQGLNIDYMPVVFPGFSWYNLKYGASPLNQRPRNGGKFLWRQFYNTVDAGCNMVYVAMYDEVDEGTAIFKVAENQSQLPTTGALVPLDIDGFKLPSDWYLRLTGEATKMLRGDISLFDTIPIVPYPDNAEFIMQEAPTIMDPGETATVTVSFKNIGTSTWTKAAHYSLVYAVDSSLNTWGVNEVDFEEAESIQAGESKTFSFNVTAPLTEGVYAFQWSLLREGGEWINNPSDLRLINVSSDPALLDDCDALDAWTSSGSLMLNTLDNQQGTGCLEFTGSAGQATEFQKVFPVPYESGLKEYDAVLQFWYYISDATLATSGLSVKLGSDGAVGENNYSWIYDGLQSGWNLISLPLSTATANGTPDLNAINWFSIELEKSAEVTSRIDEIQVFDRYSGSIRYEVLVNKGTGSGSYVEDTFIEITADEAQTGSEFVGWKVISGNPLIEDINAIQTRIRIRDEDVVITAQYKMFGKYLDDCDYLNGWGSSGSIQLNTSDQQEGLGCVEFSGSQTDEFKKSFTTPHNPGVSVESGRLEFWYYVSDASKLGSNNQLELGSGGSNDQQEYHWNLSGLNDGWNFISRKFSDASISGGTPDLSAINWFRIYNFKSGSIISRIDAIEIVDPDAGEKYALTVQNGAGDGSFYQGTDVHIQADPPVPGYTFDQWNIVSGSPVIADMNAATTSLTMGDGPAVVLAVYTIAYYSLTVENGSGDGSYIQGAAIGIQADPAPEGYVFDRWVIQTGNPVITDIKAMSTLLTMGSDSTVIVATYKQITYPLTVQSGFGSGEYAEGATVSIEAYPPPGGFEFDVWEIESGNPQIADRNADSTSLIMGDISTVVKATYRMEGTGIAQGAARYAVSFYPNPASDYFRIDFGAYSEELKMITIFNSMGQPVRKIKEAQEWIEISAMPKGLYFVKLDFENGCVSSKIIKH